MKISVLICLLITIGCSQLAAASVSDQRLRTAEQDSSNWLSYGRSYSEKRYSPLAQVNKETVEQLGLDWFFETDTARGLQATPLVIDGIMYFSAAWSVVYALDARSGDLLWKYDPQVPRQSAYKFCCGVINRGVAVWQDSIFVGSLDGRLVSIDAKTGTLNWEVQTVDTSASYSITGAPRIANGKVIIGNGGAEYGVRGYVSAYDALTGDQVWRFYTVPGNPAEGFENAQMEMAAETWNGEWWRYGGGGTVWDSIVFDPELNLLYIGVGNGSPHNQRIRSPDGGDNLFLTSILALDADTGEYRWHYQQVNGETWDYTATQQMVLLDIIWQGEPRKVIMQAPKAGFFYIIDRVSGELLSGEPYVSVNWATHIDMATGRPVENPQARYPNGSAPLVFPSGLGGHNWHPMSYSPDTGLMYIPAMEVGFEFKALNELNYNPRQWNVGYDTNGPPGSQALQQALVSGVPSGFLLAWDPIKQQEAWRVPYPLIGNGGTLATAGNLVFQGSADGFMHAYAADTGEELWSMPVQNGVMAAPIAFAIDGEQYISVLVGRGGGISMALGYDHHQASPTRGRVMTFKLGGDSQLPPVVTDTKYPDPPPLSTASEADVEHGRAVFNRFCARCHGTNAVSDGSIPDLRHLPAIWHENFSQVVLEGMMESAGMPRFDDALTERDAGHVHAYLIERAHEDKMLRESTGWWSALRDWVYGLVASLMRWGIALVY
ncbi:MAG: PQQ-dependent dehydrogenase, methanol/ethanol family [Halioglobus sp.]